MTDERLKEIDIKLRDYGRLNTKTEKRVRYILNYIRINCGIKIKVRKKKKAKKE